VDVVPAGVHDTVDLGLEGHVRLFQDGQGIHVGPDRHDPAGLPAFEDTHDTGVRDLFRDREAQGLQPLRHQGRGLELAVSPFRVLVNVPADLDELRCDLLDPLCDPLLQIAFFLGECQTRRYQQQNYDRFLHFGLLGSQVFSVF
jgi:hypothetical protein